MMPPEGPNKSEELLQRYVKERREQGANLALHPATRRILQGEVARQFGKKAGEEKPRWSAWLEILRRRWAIGVAVVAVVFTGAALFWNSQNPQPSKMAKLESAENEALAVLQPEREVERRGGEARQIAVADRSTPEVLMKEKDGDALAARKPTEALRQASKSSADSVRATARFAISNTVLLNDGMVIASSPATNSASFGEGSLGFIDNYALDFGISLTSVPQSWNFVPAAASVVSANFEDFTVAGNGREVFYAKSLTNGMEATSASLAAAVAPVGAKFDSADSARGAVAATPNSNSSVAGSRRLPEVVTLYKTEAPLTLGRDEGQVIVRSRDQRAVGLGVGETSSANASAQQPAAADTLGDLVSRVPAMATPASARNDDRFYRRSGNGSNQMEVVGKKLAEESRPSQILSRFVIEQSGEAVRLVDADGSVYDGKVEEPVVTDLDAVVTETPAESKEQLLRENVARLKSTTSRREDHYSFRATGSNTTLRQLVVVNGRFISSTNFASSGLGGGLSDNLGNRAVNAPARAVGGRAAPVASRMVMPAQRGFSGAYDYTTNRAATIEGTVSIGTTNQQWFRAVREVR